MNAFNDDSTTNPVFRLLTYENYGWNSIIGHVIVAEKLFVPKLLTKKVKGMHIQI